jgi:hypothetical protein
VPSVRLSSLTPTVFAARATVIAVVPEPVASPDRVIVWLPVMYPESLVSPDMLSAGCNALSAVVPCAAVA